MVREQSVTVGGRTVRYLEAGGGWPVVLLHAFPLSADMWQPQLERVPDGWRFLAPDLRGFGPAATDAAATLADMASDVGGWLDRLHIDNAVIGGLSMGGYVTLALFRLAPERFDALILANTKATADTAEGRAARDRMSALVRTGGAAAVADQMIPKLLGATTQATRPDLASQVRRLIEANGAAGLDGAIHAMRDRADATDLLPRLGRPALVLAGEEDELIPVAEADRMARQLSRSQLVVLPQSGHLANLETPLVFSDALANFLHANL